MRAKRQEITQIDGFGLSGAALKWIAIISMFIDHFGAAILGHMDSSVIFDIGTAYYYSRQIGRLAFPIFAFLMVQGFQHTSNLKWYVWNMLLFALISQPPFSLAFYDQLFSTGHLNIFFTLALGIIGLAAYENFEAKKQVLFQVLSLFLTGWIAEILRTDYGFYGVAFIMGLGILRNSKLLQTTFGVIMGLIQTPAASLAFFPISLYNGERGGQSKWLFYLFYPGHLLFLYLLRQSLF